MEEALYEYLQAKQAQSNWQQVVEYLQDVNASNLNQHVPNGWYWTTCQSIIRPYSSACLGLPGSARVQIHQPENKVTILHGVDIQGTARITAADICIDFSHGGTVQNHKPHGLARRERSVESDGYL